MGYRDFRDAIGTEWSAYDVVPQLVERRQGPRRIASAAASETQVPGFAPSLGDRDRRAGVDRRLITSRRPFLSSGLSSGWLCFESDAEKRRLTPIPGDWLRCREPQLAAYCEQATRVRDSSRESRQLHAVSESESQALRHRSR